MSYDPEDFKVDPNINIKHAIDNVSKREPELFINRCVCCGAPIVNERIFCEKCVYGIEKLEKK